MSPLIETVLFVFSLVALGYLAGFTGYLKPASGEGISEFAVNVAMPLLLFQTMVKSDFHGVAPWSLWGAYFCAVAFTWACGHLVMTRIFGRDARAGIVGGVSSAYSNVVLLGAPFILGIFGQNGFEVLSLLVSVHLPIMMMASIVLFEMFGRSGGEPMHPLRVVQNFLRRLFVNPLIIGILTGLAWRIAGTPLPDLIERLVDALAATAGPVALFAMGLSLRRFGISGNVRPALALSVLKLFLMPALVLLLVWLLGLPPLTAKVAVVVAALPSGINSYLIAVQFNTGQALASNQMTIATASAVLTTSFWLTVVLHVFG
ncbi:AEC family transporter [Mesorhizobium sp. M1C.F.Ca.ET.193.01.1.1]|uniref:AEC family transporter n=1 Tax=unclassified Mesorhizobium TaxID=325217 RepID=UPI000FD52BDA|nr:MULTISPECIES: AEC family transporter [unclassified Mesorhizobium]TGT01446.1 AEC family transporter [bacterium M00.F.Ca.ET.177.01.1.1]TGQ54206.1 AEC family transporter [Mesorhizobium sp. M1C.F.Ca.ET.210.01.1.1]TGQ72219.1 AEC family transporter [Mesorhizobium sp. M1C.F.Ca.ET.212.01.1.1]TGR10035.1 AEC family transporter [Mesorhizobium sp. M1C.F.Ca.ET.204.01.1.1]TGR30155.1 AEC family transporter [Mesorhizobium sp. M1C.F.Ca.ET.196.01.1.1]